MRLPRPDRRVALLAVGVALVAGGFTTLAARVDASDPRPLVDHPARQILPPTTAPPRRPTTTTTAVDIPQPEAVPEDPYAPEPDIRLGTIEIPRIGVTQILHEGVTIDRGPSHWPGTALPGKLGNVVVAGHRVTHSHPFRDIDQLRPGDQVIFTVGKARTVYEMTGNEIVTPDGVHIVDQRADHTATLFACHPPGSARYRYVVHLRQVDPAPGAAGGSS
jgi:sortase A